MEKSKPDRYYLFYYLLLTECIFSVFAGKDTAASTDSLMGKEKGKKTIPYSCPYAFSIGNAVGVGGIHTEGILKKTSGVGATA